MLTPPKPLPHLLYPQIFQGTTAPFPLLLTEHVVKMPFPHLLLLLPSPRASLPHLFPHSCFLVPGFAPLPRRRAPLFCLFTSCPDALGVSLLLPSLPIPPYAPHTRPRWKPGREVRGCAHVSSVGVRSPRLAPGERVVMSSAASHTIAASQRRPSALHPPRLCDKHQSRAAACAERRGCCYYYEGWERRRTGGCGEGCAGSVLC